MAASFASTSGWSWPEDLPKARPQTAHHSSVPGAFPEDSLPPQTSPPPETDKPSKREDKQQSKKKWGPRQCRICLETVLPTFNPDSGGLLNSPSVAYISDDPEAGRLIRPCKCKGSSKYVHEGCLQSWRHADPSYGKRNYWQCPTCGFRYRLERMRLGRAISSTVTQIVLTISVLLLAMFLLGFVADPIINLYLDPYSTLSSASRLRTRMDPILDDDPTWTEHFLKGFASLGLLSFIKVLLAMSPWQWWNLRSSGILGGGGRNTTGRDRLASISWIVVVIGVGTFLWLVSNFLSPSDSC